MRPLGGAFHRHHEFGEGDVSFTSQSPSLDVIETAFKAVVSGPKQLDTTNANRN